MTREHKLIKKETFVCNSNMNLTLIDSFLGPISFLERIYVDYLDILNLQKNGWMSVPQFGGWDQKAPGATDYSVVFSRARANRKQQKANLSDFKRVSIGNEKELINGAHHQDDPVMVSLNVTNFALCTLNYQV